MHQALRIAKAPMAKRRSKMGSGKSSSALAESTTDHQQGQRRSHTPIGRSARMSLSQGFRSAGANRSTQLRGVASAAGPEAVFPTDVLLSSGQMALIARSSVPFQIPRLEMYYKYYAKFLRTRNLKT